MSYVVKAPLVLVRVPREGDGDRIDYHYAGSIIPALTEEQHDQFLAEGLVEEIDGVDDGTLARPSKRAAKEKWDEYVVAVTADTDAPVTLAEAEATSKEDLITLYGG